MKGPAEPPSALATRLLPPVALVAVTVVFGWTFVVVKAAISHYPVLPFLGLRFGIAAAALLVLLRCWPSSPVWRSVLPVGLLLAAGYLAQTEGMVTVGPGVAGLLTGLFVVFTPIVDWALFHTRLRRLTLFSVGLALLGTLLLTGGAGRLSIGDLLVVLGALAFSGQIVLLSHGRGSVKESSLVQLLVCAPLFLLMGASRGLPYPPISVSLALALAITGLLASALAVVAQTWAQRQVSASRAGVLLAGEPAFALLFAIVLTGERLTAVQLLGAGILLLAIIGHEVALASAPGPS